MFSVEEKRKIFDKGLREIANKIKQDVEKEIFGPEDSPLRKIIVSRKCFEEYLDNPSIVTLKKSLHMKDDESFEDYIKRIGKEQRSK